MRKYHTTDTGQVRPCTAYQRACKYGEDRHFDNIEDAQEYVENTLSKKYSETPSVKKEVFKEKTIFTKNQLQKDLEDAKKRFNNNNITSAYLKRIREHDYSAQHLDTLLDQALLLNPNVINAGYSTKKVIDAIANNKNTHDITLAKIASQDAYSTKELMQTTTNKRLLQLAYLSQYADVRKNALENSLSTDEDIYAVSLNNPNNYYKKSFIERLKNAGYSTDHIRSGDAELSDDYRQVKVIKKVVQSYKFAQKDDKTNEKEGTPEEVEQFFKSRNDPKYHSYIKLVIDEELYAEKIKKYAESIPTKRRIANKSDFQTPEINNTRYSDISEQSSYPKRINTESHKTNNVSQAKVFKNNNSSTKPATYEESVALQERWTKGLNDLPVEIQKEILQRKPTNPQDGLRAIVDTFKTTDVDGQMAKNGLNNFVQHIEHMKERDVKKGLIAVNEPEFQTPVGFIKIEEHIGNRDYGERLSFRINGEKFEMGKPMNSDKWNSFIHIQEKELEAPPKKGFWAKIFG